jgi:hypothetical protein
MISEFYKYKKDMQNKTDVYKKLYNNKTNKHQKKYVNKLTRNINLSKISNSNNLKPKKCNKDQYKIYNDIKNDYSDYLKNDYSDYLKNNVNLTYTNDKINDNIYVCDIRPNKRKNHRRKNNRSYKKKLHDLLNNNSGADNNKSGSYNNKSSADNTEQFEYYIPEFRCVNVDGYIVYELE